MKTWSFTFLVCLLVSGCSFNASTGPAAASPVPTAKVEEQLRELWGRLDQGTPPANKLPTAWSPAYSVLFPTEWPPTPDTLWIRYAYAQGMDVNLHDGVYVSAPWARLELRGNSTTASIVPLSTRLEPVTTQGVVPIDVETQAVLAREAEVSASCLQLTTLPSPDDPATADIRAFYQTWLNYNGALVEFVRPNHEKFLAWLKEK